MIEGGYGRVQALRRKVYRTANSAALFQLISLRIKCVNENQRHLVIVATQVDKNEVPARRICALLHHLQNLFSANESRRASGRWVGYMP